MNVSKHYDSSVLKSYKILNRDVIKYVAIVTMFLNHIANVFLESGTLVHEILVDIGYFTAITMIYFLVEGYEYTRSHKKYAQRLVLFAVISQIPFSLAVAEEGILELLPLNMIYTLLCCFGIVHIMKTRWQDPNAKLYVMLLTLATCISDWGGMAPVFTILFVNAGKDETEKRKAWLYSAMFFGMISFLEGLERYSVWGNLLHTIGCMIPLLLSGICILYLYNGKQMERGRRFSKWFFYLFYPIHLLIFGLIRISM